LFIGALNWIVFVTNREITARARIQKEVQENIEAGTEQFDPQSEKFLSVEEKV